MNESLRKRVIVGISCLLVVILAASLFMYYGVPNSTKKEDSAPVATESGASETPAEEFDDPESIKLFDVAKVGDETITSRDLQARVNQTLRLSGYTKAQVSEDYNAYKLGVLEYWVREKMMPLIAKDLNVSVSDEDFAKEKEAIITNYGGQEAFLSALKDMDVDESYFDTSFKLELLTSKVKDALNLTVDVTDEHVKKYYDDNADKMKTEAHCTIYVLQCENSDDIEDCKARLDNGEAWDAVVADKGIKDDSTQNGCLGEMKWDTLEVSVQDAIKAAGFGKHTGVLTLSDNSKVIVKGENFVEAKPITFEDAKEDIREHLRTDALEEAFNTSIKSMYDKYNVKVLVTEEDLAK